jgi:hypothetical protein
MSTLAIARLPALADDNESLGREITLLAGRINAATHRLLKLIAEFDERRGWSGGGTVRSCAHWLNWKCGIALGAAREKLRVAHCLRSLPQIDAAFARGELSYSKVRAMTRAATAQNEEYLLMIARHGTASHIEQLLGKYRRVCRNREQQVEAEREASRELTYYRDEEGMWVIRAKLPPEAGALVVKSIEALVAPLQERQREAAALARQGNKAEATAENGSAGTFPEEIDAEDPHHYQRLVGHSRADALVAITEHFLASGGDGELLQGLRGSDRCQILLHVDIDTLREHHRCEHSHPEHCQFGHKQWLSAATARRLACDASLVTVMEDGKGNVLNIGRRARTVPPSLRRALSLRDSTCRFPGCCEARYVDAHHIKHWADGGETSLDNLVTLCRFHHRQLHQGCFSIRAESDQGATRFIFTSPGGRTIATAAFPRLPEVSAETSVLDFGQLAPNVTPQTCIPRWHGERCDFGMAVEGLLRRV